MLPLEPSCLTRLHVAQLHQKCSRIFQLVLKPVKANYYSVHGLQCLAGNGESTLKSSAPRSIAMSAQSQLQTFNEPFQRGSISFTT